MSNFRSAYRVYTTANGDRRKIEVVNGKAYRAAQHNNLVAYHPPPPLRETRLQATSKSCFRDPEKKRRQRVAGYKMYAVEGKVKSSLYKGMRWIKVKCSKLFHRR